MCNSIVDAMMQNSRRFPEKTALADSRGKYSYRELAESVSRAAGWMEANGISAGDRIIVECTQNASFIILGLACELLEAVFVPIEKKTTVDRATHTYQEVGAKCVIGQSDYSQIGAFYNSSQVMDELREFAANRQDCSRKAGTAERLFTTGTTGQPKGIIISNGANVAIAENISSGVKMTSDTVELIPLPLSHSHGLRTCYANLFAGCTAVVIDGVMNIGQFFGLIEKYRVNALDISPTLAKLLLKIAQKGLVKYADEIEYIEIGTAVLENDTKEQLKAIFTGTRLYNFYGSTEAGRSCVLDFNEFDDTGCVGYPTQNASVLVVDDNRDKMNSSKENPGLIAVSGKMMMDGYFRSEELTKETVVDGVLYTSDLGYIDEAGRVYVIGRKDDIINYKGIKIAPEEIENVAVRYKGIKDCACIPIEDPVCGQAPKLFVSLYPLESVNMQQFMDYLKTNLESNRVPVSIEIMEQIPRSWNGKLQRKRLKGYEINS